MKTPKQLVITVICAATVALFSGSLCAYEQGTYFIYDLVEKLADTTVAKRLPLKSGFLREQAKVAEELVVTAEDLSEFEIDYISLGTSDSSFGNTVTTESSAAPATIETGGFGFGQTATSAFGN